MPTDAPTTARRVRPWPLLLLLAAPAGVAIWSGWVGLGELTGFGTVRPLPGLADWQLNTAITLPIGVEAYAAFAMGAWLAPATPARARRFARASAIGALVLGALGQVAYHLMAAAQLTAAPWPVTTVVACLPVVVLGMGAALAHLLRDREETNTAAVEAPAAREGRPAEVPGSRSPGVPDLQSAGLPGLRTPGRVETDRAADRSALPTSVRSAPPAAGSDVSDLLPAGRAVARRLAKQGRALSRSALLAGLRADGHTCSSDRASALLARLRTDRTGPDRPGRAA